MKKKEVIYITKFEIKLLMKIIKIEFLIFCAFILFCNLPASGAVNQQKSDDIKPMSLLSLLEKANLRISARIYYGDEDEEEVPVKTEFYLLDKSVVEILKAAKFSPEINNQMVDVEEAYLEALGKLLTDQKDEEEDILNYLFWEAVEKNTVTKFETDYFGYGKSEQVKSGNYYLFGFTQINDEILIWNYPVFLSGMKEIEIDQNNAAAVLSDR